MSSDVCKHCTHAACLDVCPTGALFRTEFGTVVVQEDVCNGCGYCVPACPFGVIDRREIAGRAGRGRGSEVHALLRPAEGRARRRRAPRRARRSRSSSGRSTSCAQRAATRLADVQRRGLAGAQLYGDDPDDGVGGFGAFFLLLDEPEVYGLPPDPVVTTRRPSRACGGAPRGPGSCSRPRSPWPRTGAVADGLGGRASRRRLLLRPPDRQGAGLEAVHRRRTSSPAASPARRRCSASPRGSPATSGSRATLRSSRPPASVREPAAADRRPRPARAVPQHVARLQGDLADERRHLGAVGERRDRHACPRRASVAGVAPRLRCAAEATSALLAPALCTYTAVLLVATPPFPVWHEARRELPFVFAGSAAASAGAAATLVTPAADAARGAAPDRDRRRRPSWPRSTLMERRLGRARHARTARARPGAMPRLRRR